MNPGVHFWPFVPIQSVDSNGMSKRDTVGSPSALLDSGNGLLAALPRAQYQRLLAEHLELVRLRYGEVLKEPGVRIRHVYFPIDCVVSLQTSAEHGEALEVALIGREGMVGTPLVLGIDIASHLAVVQGAGTAMRMKASAFRKEFLRSKPFQKVVYWYKNGLARQFAQSVACNQFHTLRARLARYLMMTADRARSREIRLTHEVLSRMLGVRRPGITSAAGALEQRKLIQYTRGKITILDRKRLSASSCACYRIINGIYRRARTRMADSARRRKNVMRGALTG